MKALHLTILTLLLSLSGCSQGKVSSHEHPNLHYAKDSSCNESWCNQVGEIIKNPQDVTPESLDNQFSTSISRWFYGQGLGITALNIGTVVAFPPYALYLLGNAGLQIAGFKPLYITDALPEEPRRGAITAYNAITSTPGRITAAVARADYYDPAESQIK